MAARPYDLVLFGATGYTGGLTAEYLARHAPVSMRWAIAGRDRSKLDALAARLAAGGAQSRPWCVQADVQDAASLARLSQSTRVVLSTVGPYVLHGEPLVKACADAGTDYADICGEAEFVDRMWLNHHETAMKTGARIVHCCGFEALVPDLGAYYTVRQLPVGVPIQIEAFVFVDATFSKGTPLHSVITALSRMDQRRAAHRQRTAAESRPAHRRIGNTHQRLHFERALGAWVVPFPAVDPQIVRRSAVAIEGYGPDFRYGHYLQVPNLGKLAGLLTGAAALLLASQMSLTRKWLLSLRPPGDGPSVEQRERSRFTVTFFGEACPEPGRGSGGESIRTQVSGGDPGYGETSKLLAESGLCLALDELPLDRAGVLTPVVAMGDALFRRVEAAGIRFETLHAREPARRSGFSRDGLDGSRPYKIAAKAAPTIPPSRE
ncbi:MAG: saccharopine dehydrogenase family protein [Nevskiales bacterium]